MLRYIHPCMLLCTKSQELDLIHEVIMLQRAQRQSVFWGACKNKGSNSGRKRKSFAKAILNIITSELVLQNNYGVKKTCLGSEEKLVAAKEKSYCQVG